ncbi:unnamed protein product, partial [Polarella glacialis]
AVLAESDLKRIDTDSFILQSARYDNNSNKKYNNKNNSNNNNNNNNNNSNNHNNSNKNREEDCLLYIIFTSGSTGRPKGVVGRQAATLNRLAWQWRAFPWQPGEVACARTPLTFVDHVAEIFGALLATDGPPLVCPRVSAAAGGAVDLLRCVQERSVTRLVLTPTLLRAVLSELDAGTISAGSEIQMAFRPAERLSSLRMVASSGELLPCSLAKAFLAVAASSCQLLNVYGSTEVAADATCLVLQGKDDLANQDGSAVSCGCEIDNVSVHLELPCLDHDNNSHNNKGNNNNNNNDNDSNNNNNSNNSNNNNHTNDQKQEAFDLDWADGVGAS